MRKEVAPVLKNAGPLEKQLAEARKAAERAVLLEAASKVGGGTGEEGQGVWGEARGGCKHQPKLNQTKPN